MDPGLTNKATVPSLPCPWPMNTSLRTCAGTTGKRLFPLGLLRWLDIHVELPKILPEIKINTEKCRAGRWKETGSW